MVAQNQYASLVSDGLYKRMFGYLLLMSIAFSSSTASAQKGWDFRVLLDGKKIGEHSFDVSRHQGVETVKTKASFDVKVLFVTAFSYRHENTEVWQDGCLREINAATRINGDLSRVIGRRNQEAFSMQSNENGISFEGCVTTFAYWNENFLNNPRLLNSQTGELESIVVQDVDEQAFLLNGQTIAATRYQLLAESAPIDLWYDEAGRWLGLETVAKGGRTLRYEPLSLPELAPSRSGD